MPIILKDQDLEVVIDRVIKNYGEQDLQDEQYGPTSTSGSSVKIPYITVNESKVAAIGQSTISVSSEHCSYCSYCSYCNSQCKQCANCKNVQCNTVKCTYCDCDCDCNCACDGCMD